jgi:hypothetical protein
MKKIAISFCVLLLLTIGSFAQQQIRYYRVDSVKTITGEIVDIKNEKSFHKNNFTVIYLKEKESGEIYKVEVSPEWFFSLDLMKGSKIEITGSCTSENGTNSMMTRSITYQGEIFQFRDKNGFPLWRGKGMQNNRGGKGKMRRRGKH